MPIAVLYSRSVCHAIVENRFETIEFIAGHIDAPIDDESRDFLPAATAHHPRLAPADRKTFVNHDRAHQHAELRERPFELAIARKNQIVGIAGISDSHSPRQSCQAAVETKRA